MPLHTQRQMLRVTLIHRWALAAIAATSIGLTLAGCQSSQESDRETLAALETDPLASFRPGRAQLLVDLRLEGITGRDMPVPARLLRVFGFKDSVDADTGRKAAVDAAQNDGWDIGPSNRPSAAKAFFGAKRLRTGPAMVEIRQYEEDGVDKLSIRLEHTPCPSILCGDD